MSENQLELQGLFGQLPAPLSTEEKMAGQGAFLFRGLANTQAQSLLQQIESIAAAAPFRHMHTPGGHRMSVAMTNCGQVGWVTDQSGYRYAPRDPLSGLPWPAIPPEFLQLASHAAAKAGFADFIPDSCLINRYEPGARMSLHQDRNEKNFAAPIVSLSLGLPARFLFGGLERSERPRRFQLCNGDVAVWGGPARLAFHGIDPLAEGSHPLTGRCRLNLTFRRALAG